MGEAQRAPIPLTKIAALDFTAPATEPPGTACASENTRIQNYAARAIEGIAASPNDDLNLFQADGTAGANLPVCWKTWPKSRSAHWLRALD